jgi:homoserine dehydrogenase
MSLWVPILIFGVGNVGRALVSQVIECRALHAERLGVRLEIVALADSLGAIVEQAGLSDAELEAVMRAKVAGQSLRESAIGYDQGDLADIVDVAGEDNAIVVDLTATALTVPALESALDRGYGVVTANKLPLAASLDAWQGLTKHRRFRWEATVGAGLPVIQPLLTLINTGDTIHRIEGALSGTLGYLSSQLEAGQPFSAAVLDAKTRGYTEPDPRQDLGGLDAARKALILARMLGYELELMDVEVESLYPEEMDGLSLEEFMPRLPELDEVYAARVAEAQAEGNTLRYIAEVGDGKARVGLQALERSHRLAQVHSSDSIVLFHTARYSENPLVISGRGAGAVNTAAGVLGDILDLVRLI